MTNLKPFNLERALAGDAVVTRDGRKVTELYFFKTIYADKKLLAVISEFIVAFYPDGKYFGNKEDHEFDLFMAPNKITKWIIVIENSSTVGKCLLVEMHASKEDAEKYSESYIKRCGYKLITITPISWEE